MDNLTFNQFVAELQDEILPLYRAHENRFDPYGVHGRMHICRAVIFAECMMLQYQKAGCTSLDVDGIRWAAAFHDSGREGNGPDLWEKESAINCYHYVLGKLTTPSDEEKKKRAKSIASYIHPFEQTGEWGLNSNIMHDADVLEIMRPICGHGGIDGFRRNALRFGSHRDNQRDCLKTPDLLREQLIKEAWDWICLTENKKMQMTESNTYMEDLLQLLKENQNTYSLISLILE